MTIVREKIEKVGDESMHSSIEILCEVGVWTYKWKRNQ